MISISIIRVYTDIMLLIVLKDRVAFDRVGVMKDILKDRTTPLSAFLGSRLNLEISLFERLERAGHPVHMLTIQYRMHPEIRAFPSRKCYTDV